MKENKGGELQCLSVQQPTGHWIVVESTRQSLAKKNKKSKRKYKVALKMAINKLPILQC